MLSYMLPVEEKPPPVPLKNHHLQLSLSGDDHHHHTSHHNQQLVNGNNKTTPISKDTSVSSFVSESTTTTTSHSSMTPTSTGADKGKAKFVINGGKHQPLKRVSFGSSKGSMVETLIFESPVQEEPEPSPILENCTPFPEDSEQNEAEREKVRVTFFQQSKPIEVDLPDDPVVFSDSEFIMSSPILKNDVHQNMVYNRTESTESGWDNPFRPGGDLSREADQIVELIKGGKPITPTPGSQPPPLPSLVHSDTDGTNVHSIANETPVTVKTSITKLEVSKSSTNGTTKNDMKSTSPTGALEVQRGTVKPDGDASQIEHVTIKKKQKCQCCVIQ